MPLPNKQGDYSGIAPFTVDAGDALRLWVPDLNTAGGCDVASKKTSGIAEAKKLASQSNVTLIFVGIDGSQEGETHDRDFVHLPGVQDLMLSEVASAAVASGGKAVLIVMGGGAVDLSAAKMNPNISSIIWAGYPGTSALLDPE